MQYSNIPSTKETIFSCLLHFVINQWPPKTKDQPILLCFFVLPILSPQTREKLWRMLTWWCEPCMDLWSFEIQLVTCTYCDVQTFIHSSNLVVHFFYNSPHGHQISYLSAMLRTWFIANSTGPSWGQFMEGAVTSLCSHIPSQPCTDAKTNANVICQVVMHEHPVPMYHRIINHKCVVYVQHLADKCTVCPWGCAWPFF
jgi:hypothetical protein